jgi:hypothetical protein
MPIEFMLNIKYNKLTPKYFGSDYEILTQTIFSQIVNQNSVKTVDVKHNITLQGRDTSHQIDIYWEFMYGEIKYCTIIECKNWATSVEQNQLFAFKTVLQDLPGQPMGIFVTKSGYQKGVLEFAKVNGIELFELREFTEEDKKGRLQSINLNIIAYFPHSEVVGIEEDKKWITEYLNRNDIKDGIEIGIAGYPDTTCILSENGEDIELIKDLIDKLYLKEPAELPKTRKEISFTKSVFLKTTSEIILLIKINKIFVDILVEKLFIPKKIVFKDIISFILKNVLTNEERLIKNDLKLLR